VERKRLLTRLAVASVPHRDNHTQAVELPLRKGLPASDSGKDSGQLHDSVAAPGHIFVFSTLLEPIPVTTSPLHEPHQALTLALRTFRGGAKRPPD
jgi:hypothetical protein